MSNHYAQDPFLTLSAEDSRVLLHAVSQNALVSETDEKGNIIFVNDKFVEVAKYSREELLGQNHRILKSGQQSDKLFTDLWDTISNGKVWRGEIKNRAKDGTYYWVDTSIAPVLDNLGKPRRYVSVRFLISDKKKAEADILEQNHELEKAKKAMLNVLEESVEERKYAETLVHELQKFKIALDGTSDHVVITDPNGIVLYANASLERVTGFKPTEVLGKKVGTRELWGGNMEQKFYEQMWHTIKVEKKPFVGELANKRKDGIAYQALTSISPVLSKEGELEFFVAIERDITKEKEIDKAKSEFISLASHQLRTPMTAISWVAEMLGKKEKLTAKGKKYLADIMLSTKRLGGLVDTLLNVSRIDEGRIVIQPKPTELVALVKDYLSECEPLGGEKHLRITFGKHPDTLTVNTDPMAFRNIIQSIISNAIEYTPSGGSITVSLTRKPESKTFVFSVSDTGIGIPKLEQEKIFTKFTRASNAEKVKVDGTGLGMYIAWQAVKLLGGDIRFESVENKGTTFFVTLPIELKTLGGGGKSLA